MLELKNIHIKFDDFSLKDFSLKVEKGDYYVILGESGAGKSVILELLSGLIKPNAGKIFFNKEDITNYSIQKRKIGIVFQDYAVFPHLNVFNNIAYPVRKKGFSKQEIKNKVLEKAKKTEILHLLHRKTPELSGGELQRVALARTLMTEPELLLLDEPLSALDVILRDNLRNLLRNLNKEGLTVIHITHDYEEALSLANKIAVINSGKLVQKGKPSDIFNHPKSEFVAAFTGIKNFYKAKYISENEVLTDNKIIIRAQTHKKNCEGYLMIPSGTVIISQNKQESSAVNNFKGKVESIIPSVHGQEILVDAGIKVSVRITNESFMKLELSEGKNIWISFKANSVKFIKKS
ncbi:MAG: ATP-binding cassette domain-containing protein [Bacteroidales bacterium]|nr:ATP-binding cassette domain-containing protein [Bacteroidales bacterium]